jgi:hypothetical protein
MFSEEFYQHPNLPEHQECTHPTNNCSAIVHGTKNRNAKKQKIKQWKNDHAYSAILSRRFIGKAHLPSLRILL